MRLCACQRPTPRHTRHTRLKNIIGKNENKQPGDSIDYSNVVSMTDEAGNTILVDTISGIEVPDTAQTTTGRVPKMINPLLFSASVGVDIWDPSCAHSARNMAS